MIRNLSTVSVIALFALTSATANASLVGDTIQGTAHNDGFPGTNLLNSAGGFADVPVGAVVGAGPEYVIDWFDLGLTAAAGDLVTTIDFDGFEFTFASTNNTGFDITIPGPGTLWFDDLDWVDAPDAVIVDVIAIASSGDTASTGFNNLWTWTDHSVHVTFDAGTVFAGQTAFLTLQLEHSVIPEPATMTLLGLGLAGLALRRRMMKA